MLSLPDDHFEMSREKREELINKLFETVSSPSLGQLVTDAIQAKRLSEEDLAEKTRLSADTIKSIRADELFPNSIPVVLLRNLLVRLDLGFPTAEKAIRKTFDMALKDKVIVMPPSTSQIRARRPQDTESKLFANRPGEPDGRELFENKESLQKYLNKLGELMAGG